MNEKKDKTNRQEVGRCKISSELSTCSHTAAIDIDSERYLFVTDYLSHIDVE